jgi:CheY-like chemotaxis protein
VRGKEHGDEHWRVSACVADRESLPLGSECTGIIIKHPYEFAFSSRPSQTFFRINPQNLRLFLIFYFNALDMEVPRHPLYTRCMIIYYRVCLILCLGECALGNKKVILAVDDMPEILMSINAILSDDYDMRLAKHALQASAIIRSVIPDLILLDVEMPGMSGIEFLAKIRKNDLLKVTPVIFLTSNTVPDTVTQALTLGVEAYIVKPVKADVLLEKVRSLLAGG